MAGQPERFAILNEIIRLEPVVGHLYRRAQGAFEVTEGGEAVTVEPGDLIDVCIRSANADAEAVGDDPLSLRPGRPLPSGVNAAVLTSGTAPTSARDNRSPSSNPMCKLTRLLARTPTVVTEPEVAWDDLIEGYQVRGLTLRLG